MPLSRVQLMTPPGGPGNFGAVQAGDNVTIDPVTGAVTTPPGGVSKIIGAGGIVVTPPEGKGIAITLTLPVPTTNPFSAGTTILIMNASAPPGYTKSTTYNNIALRVSSAAGGSSGGTVDFSSVFTNITPTGSFSAPGVFVNGQTGQGSWTPTGTINQGQLSSVQSTSISRQENASHSHEYNLGVQGGGTNWRLEAGYGQSQASSPVGSIDVGDNNAHSHGLSFSVGWSGSPQSHDHSWSSNGSAGAGSFSGNAINLAVKYVDAILCVKD